MRTSLAGRAGVAGLTRALLLALALGACGGGEDEGTRGDANPSADTRAATAATESAPAAADTCTGPPPAFAHAVLTGSWSALQDSLKAHNVTFPNTPENVAVDTVQLCNGCKQMVPVEIRSTNLTPCLSPANMKESHPHIVGQFTVLDTVPPEAGWADTLYPGATLLLFAKLAAGPATLVYQDGANGKTAPPTAWMFWYCRDAHPRGKVAQARWRPRNGSDVTGAPGPVHPPKGGMGDDEGGGAYGWMACASGCCQFYTPPPNPIITEEIPGQGKGPETNPGSRRPTWCPAPTT
ncbi:hypothetical protein [Longimicrobium sp.]|uniref:hypothetical protein n=1 Tax=Longimicrobium sp. TaxID=2029185 RepID=UPI003B3A5F3B